MRLFNKLALLGLIVLTFTACKKSSHDHLDVGGFRIMANNETVVQQNGTVVTGTLNVTQGITAGPYTVIFRDPEGNDLTITDSDLYLQVTSSSAGTVAVSATTGWTFTLQPSSVGQANLTVKLMHGNHSDFESRPVPVTVTAASE